MATVRQERRADSPKTHLLSPAYSELINRLFPRLTGGVRWGLERTEQLLEAAGNPHRRFRSIHVAGTNGKGSVAATLANILTSAGQRTGLYTSPHLCSFRERIRVNGEPIGEAALVDVADEWWPAIEASGASFFEATTVLAFAALARAGVDVAVVEVGLGGRLDSTNVINPELSIITNIAWDHADYLGDSLTAIAREKGGIIKPGVPLVTAEAAPDLLAVFRQQCAERDAPLRVVAADVEANVTLAGSRFTVDTKSWGLLSLHTPLVGQHQVRNEVLAVGALDLVGSAFNIQRPAVETGVAGVHWPGRFDVRRAERTWIFDVAHNEAGVQALIAACRRVDLPRPVALLIGILGDKDWARMLPPLFELGDTVVLTVPPTAPPNRVWDPDRVTREVNAAGVLVEQDFGRAIAAVEAASAPGGTILVTGSFHTVGDALAQLGWSEVEPDFNLQHNVFRR
jgi:dihydrofolate synthase / folylpolyglutamate synthase